MAMAIAGLKFAVVFAFILLIDHCQAVQHAAGGTTGWTLSTLNYSQWAAQNTFKVGDTLSFVYTAGDHTVLQVSKADYTTCNTAAPLKSYMGGNNVVPLPTAGSYWFICGVPGHCPIMAFGITVTAAAAAPPPKATPAPPPGKASSPPPKSSTPAPSPSSSRTASAPSPSSTGVAPSPAKSGSSPVSPPTVPAPAPSLTVNNTNAPPPSISGSSVLVANAYMLLLGTIALLLFRVLHPF